MYEKWTQQWQASISAQHSKYFYFSPNKSKARYVYKLARLELGRFIRIIIGYNNLNAFQFKLGLATSPACRFCNSEHETFLHLATDCPPPPAATN